MGEQRTILFDNSVALETQSSKHHVYIKKRKLLKRIIKGGKQWAVLSDRDTRVVDLCLPQTKA